MAPLINLIAAPALTPTRTLPSALTRALPLLHPRQATATTTIVADVDTVDDGGTHLSGGAIAGIVIGSILGFLLLLWIIRSCTNLGRPGGWGYTFGADSDDDRVPPTYPYLQETHISRSRSRHSHGHHHHHHHHHSRHHSRHSRSPRRKSIEVRNVSTIRPAYYETTSRGHSPVVMAPPPLVAHYPPDARDVRRQSRRSSSTTRRYS